METPTATATSPWQQRGQLGLTRVLPGSACTLTLEIGGTETLQHDQVTLAGTMSLAGEVVGKGRMSPVDSQ